MTTGRDRITWGEYHMPERTPEELADLRAENRAQNARLENVERQVSALRVALVGIDDKNGLRGELREHKDFTRETLKHIDEKVSAIVPTLMKALAGVVSLVGGIVAIIVAIRSMGV